MSNNLVQGNFIGLNVAGSAAISNTFAGVYVLNGASSNIIQDNVISGNFSEGLRLADAGTTANLVAGNFIGTDVTGTTAVPNGFLGLGLYSGAISNTIGGTNAAARNVISGNASEGLRIQGDGAAWNLIEGNFIGTDAGGTNPVPNNFAGLTVFSGAASNTIGGMISSARNIISGNGSYGLAIADAGTSGNMIQGNHIGLAPDGLMAVPNFHGVLLAGRATGNTLGGLTGAARNIISGNNGSGIFVTDAGTSGNFIQGNYIGPDATGAGAAPNGFEGIYLVGGAGGNFIGGTAAGAGNIISGNNYRGIYAYGTNTSGNLIQGNFIGTKSNGTNALGNGWDGVVFFDGASSNVVGLAADGSGAGNTIAFNGYTGVFVGSDNTEASIGNTIRGNAIYSNGYIGINLVGGMEDLYGVTANDPGDLDTGANQLQNFPVITAAIATGTSTLISGTLNSTANRTFLIDVYRNTSADPSGYGSGQVYVGSATVTNDGGGNSVFAVTVNGNFAGQYFTATATDRTTGDTSEFSADVLATNNLAPSALFMGPYFTGPDGFAFTLALATNFNYRIQAATNLAQVPVPWIDLASLSATNISLTFTDRTATNYAVRFYRVVSP